MQKKNALHCPILHFPFSLPFSLSLSLSLSHTPLADLTENSHKFSNTIFIAWVEHEAEQVFATAKVYCKGLVQQGADTHSLHLSQAQRRLLALKVLPGVQFEDFRVCHKDSSLLSLGTLVHLEGAWQEGIQSFAQ